MGSNEDAAMYMLEVIGPHTEEIILAHISEESNTYDLAVETFVKKFKKAHVPLDNLRIVAAKQREMVIGGKR